MAISYKITAVILVMALLAVTFSDAQRNRSGGLRREGGGPNRGNGASGDRVRPDRGDRDPENRVRPERGDRDPEDRVRPTGVPSGTRRRNGEGNRDGNRRRPSRRNQQ